MPIVGVIGLGVLAFVVTESMLRSQEALRERRWQAFWKERDAALAAEDERRAAEAAKAEAERRKAAQEASERVAKEQAQAVALKRKQEAAAEIYRREQERQQRLARVPALESDILQRFRHWKMQRYAVPPDQIPDADLREFMTEYLGSAPPEAGMLRASQHDLVRRLIRCSPRFPPLIAP